MFNRRGTDQPHPLAVESSVAFHQADVAADPATKERLLREAQSLASQSALAGAYSYLQQAVGLIAVTLPFVVAIGNELAGGKMQGSISAYYYTHLGNYFVGSLFALGVFFLSYNHRPLPKYQLDNYLSNVASAMAIGVALFPTASDVGEASGGAKVVSVMHLVFACTLFILLAVFSLVLFTRTGDPEHMSDGETEAEPRVSDLRLGDRRRDCARRRRRDREAVALVAHAVLARIGGGDRVRRVVARQRRVPRNPLRSLRASLHCVREMRRRRGNQDRLLHEFVPGRAGEERRARTENDRREVDP